jgi:hypothetical protein
VSAKGKLKDNLAFWKNTIEVNSFILNVIKEGYRIPFIENPSSVFLSNNTSARKYSKCFTTAINQLVLSGCVIEKSSRPYCINPLTVSINSNGKERLILDLRHVNKCIKKQKFKFEGSKEALQYAKRGKLIIKFDLKSGYHHVEIHKAFQQYLGFSWSVNAEIKYYVFTVLPFGLSSAPFLFTKLMREIVKYWRSLSYPIIVYLDDGWCCLNPENCYKISNSIRQVLKIAGFVVNEENSVWEPSYKLEWLGFVWDLKIGRVEIPDRKMAHFKEKLNYVLKNPDRVIARKLASIIGQIISMSFVLGNVCQIMTRNLYLSIIDRTCWDGYVVLDQKSIDELKFWFSNCDSLPFRVISPIHKPVERILFTDASNYAVAGVLLQSKNEVVHVMFDENEIKQKFNF